ncbi:aminotransferase class I/II-fold pyridoxal phosphate-dependent enzyme [Agaribacter flavus]|uniref:Aminotransferase n=1 Tax=Agaribacter flavus TaxID=1902781 RepID=A0ABV7FPK6_9ALTE
MKYSDRAQAISPFYAMEFGDAASALELQGKSIIRLNLGEPDFGAPPLVKKAMLNAVKNNEMRYTSALGDPILREKIAAFYQSQHGITISASRVVVTAGASAALMLACAAVVNPGDAVIMNDPSYPCNRQFVNTFNGRVKLVPTDASTRFQLTMSQIEEHWDSSIKALMLATPSNPTGTSIKLDDLNDICHFAAGKGAWRIVDEIYLNLCDGERETAQSVLAVDDGALVVNSFSKFFGLTGWRLGWLIVPEDMVPVIEKLSQNLYICPSTPAQIAARACFEKDSIDECESRNRTLIQRRKLVLCELSGCALQVPVKPDGAFYVYLDISATNLDSMEFCRRLLSEKGVAMTPGIDFGLAEGHKYIRLSYATNEDALLEGMRRLREFVNNLADV